MQTQQNLSVLENCRQVTASRANLHDFLHLTAPPHLEQLTGDALRRAKGSLPACLPHAITTGGRAAQHVAELLPRVQIDIDAAQNDGLAGRLPELGAYFAGFDWCEMVGRSASGRGLCVWVRTGEPFARSRSEKVLDYVEQRTAADGVPVVCDRINSLSPVALRFVLRELYHHNPDASPLWM